MLANFFLLFCNDLALLMFTTALANIHGPIEIRLKVHGVGIYSYLTPSPSIVLLDYRNGTYICNSDI